MTDANTVEILLVEDNPHDAELMIRTLRKRRLANTISHVVDGAEALDFIYARGVYAGRTADHRPRIILLDIKLPKVSGLEVLEELKKDPSTRTIPVVMVTSSREDPDIKTAYALGANSYVVKPVDYDAFQEAMVSIGMFWLLVNQPDVR